MDKKVAAVVVAYKNKDDLAACHASLLSCPDIAKIILVDNSFSLVGSCIEYAGIPSLDGRTHHLPAQDNLGYAAGNNFGLNAAIREGADYVLICNPDVLIDDETVNCLLEEMREKGLDLISPQLLESEEGGKNRILSNPGWDKLVGRGVVDIPHGHWRGRYVPTFYGACFLASTQVLEAVGGLSEDFFLFGEEIDYTMRLEKLNFSWAISELTVVAHGRGTSISPGHGGKSLVSFFHSARSAVIVGRKYWRGSLAYWIAARSLLAGYLTLRGKKSEGRAVLDGLHQGLKVELKTEL